MICFPRGNLAPSLAASVVARCRLTREPNRRESFSSLSDYRQISPSIALEQHRAILRLTPLLFSRLFSSFNSVSRGRISIDCSPLPSIVASILYRASPIDPAIKPASSAHQTSPSLSRFDSPSADSSITRPPSSTDTDNPKRYSPALPDLSRIGKLHSSDYRENFPGSVSVSASLPGLAALASVASAPTSNLRYVPMGIDLRKKPRGSPSLRMRPYAFPLFN